MSIVGKNSQCNFLGVGQVHLVSGTDTGLCGPMASPAVSQVRYSQDLVVDHTGGDELEIHQGRGMGTDRGDPLIEEGVKETPQRVDKIVNRGEIPRVIFRNLMRTQMSRMN